MSRVFGRPKPVHVYDRQNNYLGDGAIRGTTNLYGMYRNSELIAVSMDPWTESEKRMYEGSMAFPQDMKDEQVIVLDNGSVYYAYQVNTVSK